MYEKELQTLGLSEKETAVYLAALELGPETAQNLAKKARINRPTTYAQIESLKKKGLMSEITKGKKTFYVAEDPEKLESLLHTFEQELGFKKIELGRILPGLAELFAGAGDRPKVRFFEGIEGARTVQEDILKTSEGGCSIVNLDKLFALFPKYEEEFSKKRIARNIRARTIYTRQGGPLKNANDPQKLREAKFISPEKFPVEADLTIYGRRVAIMTYHQQSAAVIIESREIAETLRAIFNLIWQSLPSDSASP